MNGSGTVRIRSLPVGLLSDGWIDGNTGENRCAAQLHDAGIRPAFNGAANTIDCVQQLAVGPFVLDFAWPKLKIALEVDGRVHTFTANCRRDRRRDAWLRKNGWLVFRIDRGSANLEAKQIRRVVSIVRALAQQGT